MKNWKCYTDPAAIQRHAPRTGQSRAERAYAGTHYPANGHTDWAGVAIALALLVCLFVAFALGGWQ
jgi:hypothetical protein